jgi:amino-acid N-acetyltransferase
MTGSYSETIQAGPPLAAAAALLSSADLPSSDLCTGQVEHFFYSGSSTDPTGLVGLKFHGAHALLRSLVVRSNARSAGLGGALLERAERHAKECGAQTIYLLTTTAEQFFRRRGYVSVDRQDAPAAIRATSEFAHLCPASSAFMAKTLVS